MGTVAQAIIQKAKKLSPQKHGNDLLLLGLSCLYSTGMNLLQCQSFAESPINHHDVQEFQQALYPSFSEKIVKLDSQQSIIQMSPHGIHETWRKFQSGCYRVIMLNYTYHQNIKNMTNLHNNDAEAPTFSHMHQNCYLNSLSFEQDPIQQFLNEQAFLDRQVSYKPSEQSNDLTSVNPASIPAEQSPLDETQQTNRKKSIFHNFQKHLIALIKKFIVLPLTSSLEDTGASLMVRVWMAFKKTRSFNKKVLHMVFGVSETGKAEEEMRKLAQEYPQFRLILEKNSVTEIQQVHAVIRQEVLRQLSTLDRSALSGCNVNRFDEFYEYFQSFLCELASGPMAKRMTKTRKHVVVERLKNKQRME